MKCKCCNKKLKLIFFKCKCNNYYCIKHQLPHVHNCSFNNKEVIKKNITKNNPKIKKSTFEKID